MTTTENWDNDFEFNPNSPSRKLKTNNHNNNHGAHDDVGQTRMSTTSSRFTLDWDAEVGASPDTSPVNTVTSSSTSRPKVFTAPNLAEWAEPGPSTPAKRRSHPLQGGGDAIGSGVGTLGGLLVTENWDDDFEDGTDTPVRRPKAELVLHQASPTKEITRNFRSMQPLGKIENKESDRPVTPGRNRASSSASAQAYYSRSSHAPYSGYEEEDGEEEEEEEEEEEFGFTDKDEDKTLTGRSSRRAGLGRLNSLTNHPLNLTPPPPVPSLPPHLSCLPGGGCATRDRENPEPLPRSPSSSVFSLPTTIAGDSMHYGSTAYLHPIASRTSSSAGGHGGSQGAGTATHTHGGRSARFFAHLPPSPPIHKERERRRLRKKSRPPPQGMFELVPVEAYSSNLAALHEVERGENRERDYRDRSPGRESARSSANHSNSHHSHPNSRPRTPQRPHTPASATSPTSLPPASQAQAPANINLTSTPSSKRHSVSSNPPATPSSSTKVALLSRIGSVKKWGVKNITRKRGTSVSQPAEVLDANMGPPDDPRALPRPTSSSSSLPSSAHTHPSQPSSRAVSPPTAHRSNPNWFFRNSDTFTTASGASASASVDSAAGYAYSHLPYSHGHHPRGGGSKADLRGSKTDLRGSKIDVRGSTTDLHAHRRSHSRRRSYDINGRANDASGPQKLIERKRSRSQTRSRSLRPTTQESQISVAGDKEHENQKEKEPGTPSKLLKRKSLGFVQLRRTISSLGNGNADAGGAASDSSASAGQARHASYSGARRATVASKGDVFQERQNLDLVGPPLPPAQDVRGRKKSLSVVKIKARQDEEEKPDKNREIGKGFIRSVRKISIVGRHRREKSASVAVPTATVAPPAATKEMVPEAVENAADIRGVKVTDDTGDMNIKGLPPSNLQDIPSLHNDPPSSSPALPIIPSDAEVRTQEEDTATDTKPPLPQTPQKTSKTLSNPTTPPSSPKRTTLAKSPSSPTSPRSPQTASLGRSTYSPTRKDSSSPDEKMAPRRSSLGDLKIPARISQAQVGLRRDLGMVKEFAHSIEQLRELQNTYHHLVVEIQGLLDTHAQLHVQQHVARSASPSFFSRPVGRKRSNTNPGPIPDPGRQLAYKQLASMFYTINSRYRISWECAELLIELGGGSSGPGPPGPSASASAPAGVHASGTDDGSSLTRRKGRERAITLAGDESKPPSPLPGMKSPLDNPSNLASASSWRAPTGRQELSQRQMILLKELLNNADSSFITEDVTLPIPEESSTVNKEWKWGDPSNSTITLPPSESSGGPSSTASIGPSKKSRTSRLGMAGLRDLLKMLKRHHTAHPAHPMPSFGSNPPSTSSFATSTTNSSSDLRSGPSPGADLHYSEGDKAATYGRRRAKTSLGPETVPRFSMYDSTPLPTRQSRGRPSLASIFRIPNSFKPHKVSGSHSTRSDNVDDEKTSNATGESSSPADEDWDQIDSSMDLDKDKVTKAAGTGVGGDGMATVRGRGRSPYLQQPPPSSFNNGGRTSPRPKKNASSSQISLYEDSPTSSSHNIQASSRGSSRPSSSHQASSSHTNSTSPIPPLMPPPRVSSRYAGVAVNSLKNGSVRSMPPQPMAELRLAMTPENIKPLVENAREVHIRLVECVAEIRTLLESHRLSTVNEPPTAMGG